MGRMYLWTVLSLPFVLILVINSLLADALGSLLVTLFFQAPVLPAVGAGAIIFLLASVLQYLLRRSSSQMCARISHLVCPHAQAHTDHRCSHLLPHYLPSDYSQHGSATCQRSQTWPNHSHRPNQGKADSCSR